MRILALVTRIIRQFLRDRRTLALLVVAPLIVLTLMHLVFNSEDPVLKVGLAGLPASAADNRGSGGMEWLLYENAGKAEEALAAQEIDAYLSQEGGTIHLVLEGSDPAVSQAIRAGIQQLPVLSGADSGALTPAPGTVTPVIRYLHGGEEMTAFDHLGPIFIGIFAFLYVFLIAGMSFLKERTSGTLERLLATPLRRWEVVIGYMVGFGLFTGLQAVIVAGYSVYALGLMMSGSFGYVLLIALLLALTALSSGTLLSTLADTEFQMIQFVPLVIVPQVFLCGLFDLETMSPWVSWLAPLMPLKYGADALRNIMIRGGDWTVIAGDVYALLAFSLLFMTANILALRKYRKI